ncbi:anti-sigma factor family protein [Streptomyces sp. NPDC017248]|uniref:anti-sigma factor family protein n=1 Tax=unclassified Streptomyces TaxID=2593676 RepID=UPI0037B9B985
MTTTADTAGHPDVAEISDLTEGLLPPDRDRRVRSHLATCAACADVCASLEEIRDLLGCVPEPERMPDDVAARLDAALAAEAAPAAGAEDPAVYRAAHPEAVSTEDPTAPVSRETSPLPDRPAGRSRAATGPGRKDSRQGRRRGRFVFGAVLTAAVLGAGGLVVSSLHDNSGQPSAQGTPTASAGTFSGDSVQNQVRSLLTTGKTLPQGSDRPGQRAEGGTDSPDSTEGPSTLVQTAVPVPDCVRQALHQSTDVLGAKTGTYAGKAAYLVVVADAQDSRRITAYVVDAACVRRQTPPAGTVLLKQSLARP